MIGIAVNGIATNEDDIVRARLCWLKIIDRRPVTPPCGPSVMRRCPHMRERMLGQALHLVALSIDLAIWHSFSCHPQNSGVVHSNWSEVVLGDNRADKMACEDALPSWYGG